MKQFHSKSIFSYYTVKLRILLYLFVIELQLSVI